MNVDDLPQKPDYPRVIAEMIASGEEWPAAPLTVIDPGREGT
jgi:hypothetical protein